jgi:hypothetical protein
MTSHFQILCGHTYELLKDRAIEKHNIQLPIARHNVDIQGESRKEEQQCQT